MFALSQRKFFITLILLALHLILGCQKDSSVLSDVIDGSVSDTTEDTLDAQIDWSDTLIEETDTLDASIASDIFDAERGPDIEADSGAEVFTDLEKARLVVVTLNTHSFQEGLSSLDKLQWIGEGLAALEADLIGLNEVMSGTFYADHYDGQQYNGTQLIQEALESASGVQYYSISTVIGHWADGEAMANVIISRYPFIESGSRSITTTGDWPVSPDQRNVVYARVDVPLLGLVNFFVTHASWFSTGDTYPQILEIKNYMKDMFRDNEALDFVVGDFNTPSFEARYSDWLNAPPFRLIDTYALANPAGFYDATVIDDSHRIDYIFAGEGWDISEDPQNYTSAIIFNGGVYNGTCFPLVSDHYGVVTVFSLFPRVQNFY